MPLPFHSGSRLLVAIGPEGGRRHNSPLVSLLPFGGKWPEASLGSGRRELGPASSLAVLPFVYPYAVTSTNRKQGMK
jgi:hypothetical protein